LRDYAEILEDKQTTSEVNKLISGLSDLKDNVVSSNGTFDLEVAINELNKVRSDIKSYHSSLFDPLDPVNFKWLPESLGNMQQ
jgi:hypothetical protein